ncbi:VOC family protein [Amycolatopsis sp. QT-25]|uniref:VOC family protein n=1 Tax=Amycolatopsis sp. QT-25 TaxID=3034022 RepID=UPI0023EBAF3C|nr:VOC family protein [Amycolatopsis sp. QT-25]WET76459.1 VOC family protein [Amycolatopsis sp. QT-25]
MPGQINWVEIPAADTTKARAFYRALFSWDTDELGDDYHVITNGPDGAITPAGDGFTQPRVYFATDDIDASTKRLHRLGGHSEDIRTVPGVGRIAHCHDDQGTPFSLYEPEPRN